ncbi:MAG: kinase/pyrophosphorylase [Cellvibrionaceae bacterium]|nr:kinase/pyrophosphorylase [Cellvibrionaceae bacterium]
MNPRIREKIATSEGFRIDIIGTFLPSLEKELGAVSSYQVGLNHDNPACDRALVRMNALNYALDNDDGMKTRYYGDADIILVGVSRSAKTPTCLYIAMQHGIFAANYPLTDDDLTKGELPRCLLEHRSKLFALTIEPKRLSEIREQRRASSSYASLRQCQWEVKEAEYLYRKWRLPVVDSTAISVEEIATQIIVGKNLNRRV